MARAIAFSWDHNASGYEIVENEATGRFLVQRGPRKLVTYQVPMQRGTLFQAFAEVEPTDAGVLAFASQYGLLGGSRLSSSVLHGGRLVKGEPVAAWLKHINEMRRAAQLWNMASSGDARGLAARMWLDGGMVGLQEPVGGVNPLTRISDLLPLKHVQPLEPGDFIKPARALVAQMVNRHLKQSAEPVLFFLPEEKDGRGDTLLRFIPSSLLGAMWLQLALAVAQDERFFTCEVCGSWFAAKRMKGSRPARQYCSNACSQKAYRQRTSVDTPTRQ